MICQNNIKMAKHVGGETFDACCNIGLIELRLRGMNAGSAVVVPVYSKEKRDYDSVHVNIMTRCRS